MSIFSRNKRKIAPYPPPASQLLDPSLPISHSKHGVRSSVKVHDREKMLTKQHVLQVLTTKNVHEHNIAANSSGSSTGRGSSGSSTGRGSSGSSSTGRGSSGSSSTGRGSSGSSSTGRNSPYQEMAALSSTLNNSLRMKVIKHKIQLPTIGFFNSTLIAYLIGELHLLKHDKPEEEKNHLLNTNTSNIVTVYFNDKCFSPPSSYSTAIKFLAAAFENSKKTINTIVLENLTLTSELLAIFSLLRNTQKYAYNIKKLILRNITITSYEIFAELMNVIKSMQNISLLDFTGLTFTLPEKSLEKCVVLFIKDMVENFSTLDSLNIQDNAEFDTILAKYFSDKPIDKFSIIGITNYTFWLQSIQSIEMDRLTLKLFKYNNNNVKTHENMVRKTRQLNFNEVIVNEKIKKEVTKTYQKAISTGTAGGRKLRKRKIYAKTVKAKTNKIVKAKANKTAKAKTNKTVKAKANKIVKAKANKATKK